VTVPGQDTSSPYLDCSPCPFLVVVMMKKTILLADDSATIQRLVAETFGENEGFRVVSVSNGDAAVKKFEEVEPTAVLADVFMPGKNGYEVCAFVRGHPVLDRTPVILLVGAFETFDEVEAARVGATGHMTKPFEPQVLFEMVSAVTDSAAAGPGPSLDREDDILGLDALFPRTEIEAPSRVALSQEDVDLIADRVISRVSAKVIEGIAWEVVPEIAEKVVRDEVKKHDER
jgi:CheY-like chemotaxis protein